MPRNKNLMDGVTLVPVSDKPGSGVFHFEDKGLQRLKAITDKAIEERDARIAELNAKVKEALIQKNMIEADESPIISYNNGMRIGIRDDEKTGKPRIASKRTGRGGARTTSAAVARVPKGLSL